MSDKAIKHISIEQEVQQSYLEYAMSVIVSRALPDSRDGLKPVHRRILYAMHDTGNTYDKPYRKSAKIVGEVLGNYHPHGDAPVYSSMVRMAQTFSLRETLIDGQGNFGSVDGDPPAQMRYTEVRLQKISESLLQDIASNTVDFQDNYDGSTKEPKVLPARFPNLLVNGAGGIAVGMATNIPTHNLSEVMDACIAHLANPEISVDELTKYVPGPDFPTGGAIIGMEKAKIALITGRGSVPIRGSVDFESDQKKEAIIIQELPYQVNKADLIQSIEALVKDKVIDGITEIRDESNKLGIRVAIDIKKGFEKDVILNSLYKYTQLQTSFGVNMLALSRGKPLVMNLKDIISNFITFRAEVITRRTKFLLQKARERAHILVGLLIAVSNIDVVISLIRSSKDVLTAKEELLKRSWNIHEIESFLNLIQDINNKVKEDRYFLTEHQVKAILEMRLQRLTALEKSKIDDELNELAKIIKDYIEILTVREKLNSVMRLEFEDIKSKFSTPRRTKFIETDIVSDLSLIPKEDVVVTFTKGGYIKRNSLDVYKAQKRGGRGKSTIDVQEDDITCDVIITHTHASLLFFSDVGKVYKLPVHKLPMSSLQSRGRAIVNLLQLSDVNEKITNLMQMPEDDEDLYLMFATAKGKARRNAIADFANINASGKIAIRMDDDELALYAVGRKIIYSLQQNMVRQLDFQLMQ